MKDKLSKVLLIVNLIILDGVVGVLIYRTIFSAPQKVTQNLNLSGETPKINVEEGCNNECRGYIDQKLSSQVSVTPTATPKVPTPTAKTKVKSVSYVPIPGAGSTLATDWTALAGTDFYLGKADFPGLTEVYFEANVKLLNGNGAAFVRVFDVIHGIAVVGSEVQTSNQTSTFLSSGKISLWEGFNHYQVQAKSLTADTTVYESGRLKMVSEN